MLLTRRYYFTSIDTTRKIPGEAENGVGMNRSVREGKKSEALLFERSNELDTALYKNYLYLYYQI